MTKLKEDLKLAKAIIKGNEKIFNQFFTDYYPKLFRFIMSRVKQDRDLADDFAQQTMCNAIDKMHTYRGEAALFTWMCQISRSLIYAHYLKDKRRNTILKPLADTAEIRDILDNIAMNENQQPENISINHEIRDLISEVMDNLPNNYGDLLEWKYVEQLSVNEIADKLKTTNVSVQSSLSRARAAFKNVINKLMQNDELNLSFKEN
ncbi:MAG: RNA polymerase sigma factor [Marinicellaceae bacterium]